MDISVDGDFESEIDKFYRLPWTAQDDITGFCNIDDDLHSLEGLVNATLKSLIPNTILKYLRDECGASSPPNNAASDRNILKEIDDSEPQRKNRHSGNEKPQIHYSDLVQMAIEEKGMLAVNDIYSWVLENFPYFRTVCEIKWKAAIRHVLTLSPCFHKAKKVQRGWLWDVKRESHSKRRSYHSLASTPHTPQSRSRNGERSKENPDFTCSSSSCKINYIPQVQQLYSYIPTTPNFTCGLNRKLHFWTDLDDKNQMSLPSDTNENEIKFCQKCSHQLDRDEINGDNMVYSELNPFTGSPSYKPSFVPSPGQSPRDGNMPNFHLSWPGENEDGIFEMPLNETPSAFVI